MNKLKLFISYSHKDDTSRQEFDKWLVALRDKELIDSWFDGNMIPGDRLMSKIHQKMDGADIIVLLLSQDYLASDSCKEEMNYALNSPQKKVVPIILRECTWHDTGCEDLLALPKDGKPVSKWSDREDAWRSVYEGMKEVVSELASRFDVNSDFFDELDQIEFVTQGKKGTTLGEIFVFPNLTVVKDAFKKETVEQEFFYEKKKKFILIKGREFSGKSALLKRLFSYLGDRFSPIILNGNEIHKTLNFSSHFKKEFGRQRTGSFDEWMKLENKIALIDNFDHRVSHNILRYLDDNFVMTIVAVDDEEYMLYFKDEPSFTEFTVLTLGQFNLVKQEELIRKWFQASRQNNSHEINDLDIDKLESRVNNVITVQRIVPRYPFYILSILQSLETFMPSDIRITAYGHCYQALITAQLVKKNIKYEDLDTSFNYLRTLAYNIYDRTKDGSKYSKDAYLDFRASYKEKFIISEALINKIENDDYAILDIQEDYVRFEHSYIYYFFLGMCLAFIESEEIIDELCEKIYLRQNAFILIFTIHHTQNRVLLDTIRLHCVYSFEEVKPAELSTDETRFMNNLIAELPKSIVSDTSTSKNRADQRKNKGHELEADSEDESTNEIQTSITTRFCHTTRLRSVLRDFQVYTHWRAIKQRGDRREFQNPTHKSPRRAPPACQWT